MSWRLRIFLWLLHRAPEQVPIRDVQQYRQSAEKSWKSNRWWIDGRLVPVKEVSDRMIPNRHGDNIRVRMYQPHQSNGKTMFYLHGGGWVGRNLDTYDNFCRRVCRNTGTTVYSIEYRKSPETPFPGAVEDGIDVIHTLISDSSVNPDQMLLCGDSAGGNMAITIAFLLQDEFRFQKLLAFYPPLSADLNYPSFEMYGRGFIIEKEIIAWMRDQYLTSEEHYTSILASPLYHQSFDFLPEIMLTTGGKDPLQDHAKIFAQKVQKSGHPITFHEYADLPHGFYLLYNLSSTVRRAYQDVYKFLA